MAKNKTIETLTKAESIKPIADFHGIKICTHDDYGVLTEADIIDAELNGEDDIAGRVMGDNGLPARSKTKHAAVNPDRMFRNRVRYIEEDGVKKMQVVIDYRAIMEQETGKVYLKRIPCYQIVRNKDKELVVEKVTTVDDTDFIENFTDRLSVKSMLKVLPCIDDAGSEETDGEIEI